MKTKPEQVRAMLEQGIPARAIARRLKKSERQILRIKRRLNIPRPAIGSIGRFLDTQAEYALWQKVYDKNLSIDDVAFAFGVNRLKVYFKLGLYKQRPCPLGARQNPNPLKKREAM